MKKIVALVAIASLACGMIFADELAVANEVVDFKGEAKASWGLDLDAGQHGFKNSSKAEVKVKLWGETTKSTEEDDIWAELKIKTTEADLKQSSDKDENVALDGGKMSVEEATLHINDFFVGIKTGDLMVGEYKPDAAIHSDVAWLDNFGWNWKNGIQAGYANSDFKFAVDFRSMSTANTDYTSAYGIKVGAELKDSNSFVEGLSAYAGMAYNLSWDYKDSTAKPEIADKVEDEIKTVVDDHEAKIYDKDKSPTVGLLGPGDETLKAMVATEYHSLPYAAKVAYKLSLDDDMYLKPSVGFRGSYRTGKNADEKAVTYNENELALGVLFGWGAQADANAGVPYLDDDNAKKVTPGVGVAAYIPFDVVGTNDDVKMTYTKALTALIAPSFYLGGADNKFVENLNAAAYGEIGIYKYVDPKDYNADGSLKDSTEKDVKYKGSVKEGETTAIAFAAGLTYKIALDNGTVTPKAGIRYANGAYVANGLEGDYSKIFTKLGAQRHYSGDDGKKTYDGDFFNLKAGCDFADFIPNTTFFVDYASANLANAIATDDAKSDPSYRKDKKYYNVKLGTLDLGVKIAF